MVGSMNKTQLDALAQLTRADTTGKAYTAALLVLVDGKTQADAAKAIGSSNQAVWNAVQRFQNAEKLAKIAAGV